MIISNDRQFTLAFHNVVLKIVILLLFLHAMMAYLNLDLISPMDTQIAKMLPILKYIGIDIEKPGLGGYFPDDFYKVHVAIPLLSIWVCSIHALIEKILFKTHFSRGVEYPINTMITKYKCSFNRARWIARFYMLIGLATFAYFLSLIYNAMYGWYVFSGVGLHGLIFYPMVFIFPGMYGVMGLIGAYEVIWSDILLGL